MPAKDEKIIGLTSQQVLEASKLYGKNALTFKRENGLWDAIKSLAKEPMILLLLVASTIYFISGSRGDGLFMLAAIVLVAAISLYQDSRSRNALEKLKSFTQPLCKVIRDGKVAEIMSEDLVMGDSIMIEEGTMIAADGVIVSSNDFSVNESILTGESMSVFKDSLKEDNKIFRGTTVASGLAIVTITAIGNSTKLGSIGISLESIQEEKTPLEIQVNNFVKKMVLIGAIVFIIVWVVNFYRTHLALDSLLKALTLAMSILPEEIPVAFTTFMALGAWRLMKMGIVVKQMKTVETLGSATVICTDKTGTLTENKMALAKLFLLNNGQITEMHKGLSDEEKELITLAMWSSEPIPFDPMEVALHESYANVAAIDERPHFKMVHEYPLDGKPPMMTHLFENENAIRIIAAKGAPEAIINVSNVSSDERKKIEDAIALMAADGLRVLGVGVTHFEGNNFPATQQEFQFRFIGLVAFYDPPKANIAQVLQDFYKAGMAVKIVTGDNSATAVAIAKQVGFKGYDKATTGNELMLLSDTELKESVQRNFVFTRMFPEAKLKIIQALKANNEIVAMTGDGVNDGPALKAAHIGIAMGKKGTEIAKQAASLILVDDDLARMLDAVAMGRKIYANLKKAIQYIISIHIPIILTVFIPLILGWVFPNIFSPVHVIFLELVMGPTCSIIYENEPMEKNTMLQKPRSMSVTFFSWTELATSVLQGVLITAGTLGIYLYAVSNGCNESTTRSMVFTTLIAANITLTLVNRSFYYSILATMAHKNKLVVLIICVTVIITALLMYVPPLAAFFGFVPLTLRFLLLSIAVGFVSVIWYEAVKAYKRRITHN
jgi:Ca2+-transporting ATPase